MDVVFFGTPAWAARALEAVAASAHRVLGVVTAPDAPAGRSLRIVSPAVKLAAERLGLAPVLQPQTLKGEAARASILDLGPRALVVVAYGHILPGRLLDAPAHGAINLHFSLLPRHRGASPVQHAVLAGDAETGVTTMRMDRGLDTGPILLQRSTAVAPRETASELGARLAELGAALLVETLDLLERGAVTPRPQDASLATAAPLLAKRDGRVLWAHSAEEIERRVRAFDPWPPVICRAARGALRLVEVEALPAPAPRDAAVGTVLRRDGDAVDVAAGAASTLRIRKVQPANGRPMTAAAALAGRCFALGDRLLDGDGP